MENPTNAPAPARPANAVAVFASKLNSDSVQAQFANALADHKEAFIASLIEIYSGDTSLQACQPNAVITEALKAANLNLPINKALGFAYLIAYNKSVRNADGSYGKIPIPTFVMGYKGLIQLALRSGQYKHIHADTIREGELDSIDKLTGEIRFGRATSEKIIGYFAHIELLNGYRATLYMSVSEMAQYAKRFSKGISGKTTAAELAAKANAAPSASVGWEGNFNDMALKTCIRRLLSKYGYLSITMGSAMSGEAEMEESMAEPQPEQAPIKTIIVDPIPEQPAPASAPAPAPAVGGQLFNDENPDY